MTHIHSAAFKDKICIYMYSIDANNVFVADLSQILVWIQMCLFVATLSTPFSSSCSEPSWPSTHKITDLEIWSMHYTIVRSETEGWGACTDLCHQTTDVFSVRAVCLWPTRALRNILKSNFLLPLWCVMQMSGEIILIFAFFQSEIFPTVTHPAAFSHVKDTRCGT